VAAGRYARYALISLGAWNALSDRLLQADNVRTTLASVAHGEALLGIVYETDALSEKGVRIVDTFPATSHPAIVYPGALTVKARPGAARYLAFLRSDDARKIFARYGFRS
jgi:molybdate transport system substrate-binding protein